MFYWFLERECERETLVGCLLYVPQPGIKLSNPQPRCVSWPGIKPATFLVYRMMLQPTEPPARAVLVIMETTVQAKVLRWLSASIIFIKKVWGTWGLCLHDDGEDIKGIETSLLHYKCFLNPVNYPPLLRQDVSLRWFCCLDIMYQEPQEQPSCFRNNMSWGIKNILGVGIKNLRDIRGIGRAWQGLGNPQEMAQEYTIKGLLAPCYSLFVMKYIDASSSSSFFFTEFQSILHGSALAEAWDTSTSEKHFNYSEALSVVKQFHPPKSERVSEYRKQERDSSPLGWGFS